MQISKISPLISFKSSVREVVKDKKTGEVHSYPDCDHDMQNETLLYSNYTSFFRTDLDKRYDDEVLAWEELRGVLREQFGKADCVHTYDFACSDGSEAYSLALCLTDEFKDESSKFFPIFALDFDSLMINRAKSAKIPCTRQDILRMCENLSFSTQDEFLIEEANSNNSRYRYVFCPSEKLSSKINFKLGRIEDEIGNVEKSNSLVFCRNVWPYFDRDDAVELLNKLLDKLDSSSLLVIGQFDMTKTVKQTLLNNGYYSVAPYVYKKGKDEDISDFEF